MDQKEGPDSLRHVTLSFMDSESKLILNRIYEKLESLDQKMGFVTEFLLHKISGGVTKEPAGELGASEPRRKMARLDGGLTGRDTPDSAPSPHDKSGSDSSSAASVPERWEDKGASPKVDRDATPPSQVPRASALPRPEAKSSLPAPLPQHSYEEPEEDPGPPPVPGHLDVTSAAMRHFPEEALRRAAEKASKSFSATQPKVFAWQMFRETHSDAESAAVKIPLRASHGEHAEHFLARQTAKVRGIAYATLEYFGWANAPEEFRLTKAKLICSHIKNNAKVRNWTLREGMRNGTASGAGAARSPGLYPAALVAHQLSEAQRSVAASSASMLTDAQRSAALQILSNAAAASHTQGAGLSWPQGPR